MSAKKVSAREDTPLHTLRERQHRRDARANNGFYIFQASDLLRP